MELIPIFAFIVLVASIATFIFSLAAYILFKVREKRGKYSSDPHPKAFKAELVAPNYYYLSDSESSNGGDSKVLPKSLEMQRSKNDDQDNKDLKVIDKTNGNELVWR